MRDVFTNPPRTLADYLAILRRRKWIIVALPVLTALAAFALSTTQAPVYQAHATILVNRAGIVTAITNVQDPATYDATRFLTTQSTVARSSTLAARVVAAAGVPGVTPGAFLGLSSVTPHTNADLLDMSVSHPNPNDAVLLVNAYAREYTRYRTALDTARVNDALRTIRVQTARMQARGRTSSPAYQTLIQYQGQLETVGKLLANNTSVLQTAEGAGQISPRPKQDLILGGLLGVVLGFGLALLMEALDRRVRSGEEVEAVLGLPLLGRISPPPRELGSKNRLVMLAEPRSARAETFRKLRTSIEFANLESSARTIMFTSGVQREGKSTTVANLAIAFARAGRRVALVDLDVRRPSLHSFFDVRASHGIAEVVVNNEELAGALQHVTLPAASSASLRAGNGRPPVSSGTRWVPSPTGTSDSSPYAESDDGRDDRVLHFLACGTVPSVDREFLHNERLSAVIKELGELFDVVLVDAPPFLAVGDAMTLSANVDAIVVVTRLGTQRPILRELARELQHCQAPTLGFVLTGVPVSDGYGYGYGHGYSHDADLQRGHPTASDVHASREPGRQLS